MRVRWLVRLFPRVWRRTYGDELTALLEQYPITLRTVLDLVRSAAELRFAQTQEETHMAFAVVQDRTVIRTGLVIGSVLGAVQVSYTLLNNLANPDAQVSSLLNGALTATLLLGPAAAGFVGAWRSRRTTLGLGTALVSFALSAGLGFATLWLVTFVCRDTIRHNTFILADFQRSGMQDLDAFIVEDALGATFFGGLLGLTACVACGLTGGVLGTVVSRLRHA